MVPGMANSALLRCIVDSFHGKNDRSVWTLNAKCCCTIRGSDVTFSLLRHLLDSKRTHFVCSTFHWLTIRLLIFWFKFKNESPLKHASIAAEMWTDPWNHLSCGRGSAARPFKLVVLRVQHREWNIVVSLSNVYWVERSSRGLNVFVLNLKAYLFVQSVKALAFCSFVANPCFWVACRCKQVKFSWWVVNCWIRSFHIWFGSKVVL